MKRNKTYIVTIVVLVLLLFIALAQLPLTYKRNAEIRPVNVQIYYNEQISERNDKVAEMDEIEPQNDVYDNVLLEKIVEMTFYLPTGNTCKNQEYPVENHTVAFSTSYYQCECDIYTLDGELIGHYYIDDTGYGRTEENGKGTIQNTNTVDVFFELEENGWNFIEQWGNEVQIVIYEKEVEK